MEDGIFPENDAGREDITDAFQPGDYVRANHNSGREAGRIYEVNPNEIYLRPRIKLQPNGDLVIEDSEGRVPVVGSSIDHITEDEFKQLEAKHPLNYHHGEPIRLTNGTFDHVGVLQNYMNDIVTLQPYLINVGSEFAEERDEPFSLNYSNGYDFLPIGRERYEAWKQPPQKENSS